MNMKKANKLCKTDSQLQLDDKYNSKEIKTIQKQWSIEINEEAQLKAIMAKYKKVSI